MSNVQNIRNFCIVAHIDHGKSTLADRLLEITGTVSKREMRDQLLDSNPIERERGITIKLAPVKMIYKKNLGFSASNSEFADSEYILNLIDTPGHADFSYEVRRSLAACEGAILLVDATQGVQAQTLAHFHSCQKLGLTIIPVVNKIDIATADVAGTRQQIHDVLGFDSDSILSISAKTGQGVPELLSSVIKRIPPPSALNYELNNQVTRALVFNSNFDMHLGVIAWVRMVSGQVGPHDKLYLVGSHTPVSVLEVGVFTPRRTATNSLSAGEVGYVVTNLKDLSRLTVGDTLSADPSALPLPGYQSVKPVVFFSFYSTEGNEVTALRDALTKLQLNDSALQFTAEFSPALGHGFRVGFLGLLHADVIQERLEREFDLSLIASAPSVQYQVVQSDGTTLLISKAMDLPDPSSIRQIREPVISLSIFVPQDYVGPVIQLCQNHRGQMLDLVYHGRLVNLSFTMPLSELIRQFYDQLKNLSQGFATLDYELTGFAPADLVRLDIFIAGDRVDVLSQIVPRTQAASFGRHLVDRLKNLIPRRQFAVAIQAAVGGKILARSDVKAFRKDVTGKLYGGDQTRKDKLLKKQKRGKARLKRFGHIDLPQEVFLSILRV